MPSFVSFPEGSQKTSNPRSSIYIHTYIHFVTLFKEIYQRTWNPSLLGKKCDNRLFQRSCHTRQAETASLSKSWKCLTTEDVQSWSSWIFSHTSSAVVLNLLMLQPFYYSSSCCADPNYKIIFVAVSLLLIWIIIKYLCFPMVLDDSWKGQGCPTPKGSYPTVEYHCSRPSISVVNLLLLQEA